MSLNYVSYVARQKRLSHLGYWLLAGLDRLFLAPAGNATDGPCEQTDYRAGCEQSITASPRFARGLTSALGLVYSIYEGHQT